MVYLNPDSVLEVFLFYTWPLGIITQAQRFYVGLVSKQYVTGFSEKVIQEVIENCHRINLINYVM